MRERDSWESSDSRIGLEERADVYLMPSVETVEASLDAQKHGSLQVPEQ